MTKKPKNTNDMVLNDEKIDKLLFVLNKPETTCTFWRVDDKDAHLMGIRPITRTTVEMINENGFNPYEKKVTENLFKCFKIYVINNKEENIITAEVIEKKNEIEKNGIIYIKHHDPIFIYDLIRGSK